MGSFSPLHWITLAVITTVLLGGGRFSAMMGDVAKGVKSFRYNLSNENAADRPTVAKVQAPADRENASILRDQRHHDRQSA